VEEARFYIFPIWKCRLENTGKLTKRCSLLMNEVKEKNGVADEKI